MQRREMDIARAGVLLRGALALLVLASLLTACHSAERGRVRIGWTEKGEASWYGEPFHGQRTASGERYDMYQMTAAHRELPLGTVIEVRNVENDRRVQVRVNDRGPFVRGRILDLSYAAARELGAEGTGVIRVSLRVIALPPVGSADELA